MTSSFETEDIIQEELFFNLGRVLTMKIMLERHQTSHKVVIETIFRGSFILKRSKQTLVPAAILNSFSQLFSVSTNCIDPLLSLGGERWKISIPSRRIQKQSNSKAQRNKTEQIDDKARVFSGSIFNKTWNTD